MSFAEAAAQALSGGPEDGDLDARIDEALECPCVADLKEGPCGDVFSHAFRCFIKSDHPDKGMDCIPQFKAFQDCLQSHPEHQKSIIESATESTEEQESKAPEAAATTATA